MQHQFDSEINKKLHQMKYAAGEEVWRNIEFELNQKEAQERRSRPLVPAAVLALMILSGLFLWNNANVLQPDNAVSVLKAQDFTENATQTDINYIQKELSNSSSKNKISSLGSLLNLVKDFAQVEQYKPKENTFFKKENNTQEIADALPLQGIEISPLYAETSPLNNKPLELPQSNNRKLSGLSSWHNVILKFWDNPALTGDDDGMSGEVKTKVDITEDGKVSIKNNMGAYITLPNTKIGLGFFHQQETGIYTTTGKTAISLSYPLLNCKNGTLYGGATLAYLRRSVFPKEQRLGKELEPVFGINLINGKISDNFTKSNVGVDAGLWFQSNKLIAGISAVNLNKPLLYNSDFGSKEPILIIANASYNMAITEDISVMPRVQLNVGGNNFSAVECYARYKKLWLGSGVNVQCVETSTHFSPTFYTGLSLTNSSFVFASLCMERQEENLIKNNLVEAGIKYKFK